jgi:8-oxo-dGTP pyrophosphatase MutT (NUDIX family)
MDVVSSEIVQKFRVFSIRRLLVRERGAEHEYHVVQRPDSVQVVAVTTDGRMVMVEQERQGTQQRSLEFVAGLIDSGEAPNAAAARELEEETGYRAGQWRELGWYYTDPAILTNRVTVFLAEGCERVGAMNQDAGENIRTRLEDVAEVPRMIENGTITHGLVVSAWYLYQSLVQRSRSRT